VKVALVGRFYVFLAALATGSAVLCRPAFALLAQRAAEYNPEHSEHITRLWLEEIRPDAPSLVEGGAPPSDGM
jgi:hypothetical protein